MTCQNDLAQKLAQRAAAREIAEVFCAQHSVETDAITHHPPFRLMLRFLYADQRHLIPPLGADDGLGRRRRLESHHISQVSAADANRRGDDSHASSSASPIRATWYGDVLSVGAAFAMAGHVLVGRQLRPRMPLFAYAFPATLVAAALGCKARRPARRSPRDRVRAARTVPRGLLRPRVSLSAQNPSISQSRHAATPRDSV